MLSFLITTSTKLASMSLYKDDKLLANINVNVRKTHSTNILEQVDMLFNWAEERIENVDNLIISKGPGSFTGVRIALALVKGLFSLDKINTFTVSESDAIYYKNKDLAPIIVCALDSRKGKIYYNIYKNNVKIVEDSIGNIKDVLEFVKNLNDEYIFAGDVAANYSDIIGDNKNIFHEKLMANANDFYEMFRDNKLEKVELSNIEPYYLEKSQAEKDYKGDN